MRIREPRFPRLLPAALLAALLAVPVSLQAASFETLVMPGPVAGDHAEIEEECSACHDLFDRNSQRGLCLDCHEQVAADLTAGSGFHGRHPAAGSDDCRQCHGEHKGRDADIVGLQPDLFDHDITDFPLTGVHGEVPCNACHEAGSAYFEASNECSGCHDTDDPHAGNLGSDCSDCHETAGWRGARFDHDATEFSLSGGHAEADCLGCHETQRYEAPQSECIDCHRQDDTHGGRNGEDCGQCHGTTEWQVIFDHAERTSFPLTDAHALLSCRSCHVSAGDFTELPTDCHGCHAGDDPHLGRNGTACGDCHNEKEWAIRFDHLEETGFALSGTHSRLECSACHTEGLEVPLIPSCEGCHDDDDRHQGTLPECSDCHGQSSWTEDLRFQHDLTDFALVGLHRVASCEQCHDSLVFAPVSHQCTDCHSTEDVHESAMGSECQRCHNPAGWTYWRFDHDSTEFALTGAHAEASCAGCHPPGQRADRRSRACIACHRSDDVHRGGFGQNCDRCHLTTDFGALKRDL
jgi:hypothetical protein